MKKLIGILAYEGKAFTCFRWFFAINTFLVSISVAAFVINVIINKLFYQSEAYHIVNVKIGIFFIFQVILFFANTLLMIKIINKIIERIRTQTTIIETDDQKYGWKVLGF